MQGPDSTPVELAQGSNWGDWNDEIPDDAPIMSDIWYQICPQAITVLGWRAR